MRFSEQHLQAFCLASHDRNPLHMDAAYAARSQFGQQVVFGMAALLWGLGRWCGRRPFRLTSLRAAFRKAILLDEPYEVGFDETDGEVAIRFHRGPVDYIVVRCGFEWSDAPFEAPTPGCDGFEPLREARADASTEARETTHCLAPEALPRIEALFGISGDSMPRSQLTTLLWASYHVGMWMPGRQALFTEFECRFTGKDDSSARIDLQLDAATLDHRFNRLVQTGTGTGLEHMRIVAFQRPAPADFSLADMPENCRYGHLLEGKKVFISGATRGFGAALARVCSLAGADLALNYRGDAASAELLQHELTQAGTEVSVFRADMADPVATSEMAAAIQETFGSVDLIFANAAPAIRELHFLEQDTDQLLSFIQSNLKISLETKRYLLPLLSTNGRFVQISTEFLATPVRGFSHYLAAKAAQETMIMALSLEFPEVEFTAARLPRILTDQTSLPYDFDPPLHPGEIARDLVIKLQDGAGRGFRVLEWD